MNSFAALSGLSFTGMENIAAGSLEGKNVAYPIATEDLKMCHRIFKSHLSRVGRQNLCMFKVGGQIRGSYI